MPYRNVFCRVLPIAFISLAFIGACSAEPPLVDSDVPYEELFGQGEAMAETLCQACHAIGANDTSVHPDAPALRDLSKTMPLSELRQPLTEGIITQHPDMPEWAFEPQHVDAILTYIESVQTGDQALAGLAELRGQRDSSSMVRATLKISNRDARRLWLSAQGLAEAPVGKLDLDAVIKQLGFVQLDTIQVVARAHHHILWSRNQNYREPMLNKLMAEHRGIFEHFTHDASVLPIEFYPMWQRQFRRLEEKVRNWDWHKGMLDANGRNAIKERIAAEGPLCTKAFDTKIKGEKKMWSRPPHKLALDYMWYAGELSTSHREGFTKFYDLTERVIPETVRAEAISDETQIDLLCTAALDRLAFGSEGDVQRFWDAVDNEEARNWAVSQRDLVPVEIEGADRVCRRAFAPGNIEARLSSAPSATSRLRILNPFDPVIRDRARLARLFGFEYRVEMFVPASKRVWGYYVYPILEGDRFVGRIEVKADRKAGQLNVLNLWVEPGTRWTGNRAEKLEAELARMARFVGLPDIVWRCRKASSIS